MPITVEARLGCIKATSTISSTKLGMIWKKLGEAHQKIVHQPAIIAGGGAQQNSDPDRAQCRGDADQKRDARTKGQSDRHVAAQYVAARQQSPARRAATAHAHDVEWTAREDQRRGQRDHHNRHEHGKAEHGGGAGKKTAR